MKSLVRLFGVCVEFVIDHGVKGLMIIFAWQIFLECYQITFNTTTEHSVYPEGLQGVIGIQVVSISTGLLGVALVWVVYGMVTDQTFIEKLWLGGHDEKNLGSNSSRCSCVDGERNSRDGIGTNEHSEVNTSKLL